MIRQALLVLRLAGQDLKGNAAVHAVALLIITAAFLTVGVFVLVAANLKALAGHWQEKVQVCVYLAEGATVTPEEMRGRLAALPEVAGVDYVSKETALKEFKTMLGDDARVLEGLEENPLPPSFTLRLKENARGLERVKALAEQIAVWPGVEEADYGGPWLASFTSALRVAQAGVMLLGALIVAAIVFIIGNTIRLTMYSRREEIGIMRLVGASTMLIRTPFVLEGMLQGASAALLAIAGLYILYRAFLGGHSLPGLFAGFNPVFITPSALLALIIGGTVLGAAASFTKFSDFFRT
jgi:cell division transport system permease protein